MLTCATQLPTIPSSSHSIYRDIISDNNIVRFARDKQFQVVDIGQKEIKFWQERVASSDIFSAIPGNNFHDLIINFTDIFSFQVFYMYYIFLSCMLHVWFILTLLIGPPNN